MGSFTSKNESAGSVIPDLYASETTNQLLKIHLASQKIADVLKHSKSTTPAYSMSMSNADQLKSADGLGNPQSISTRVRVAQCKIHGFDTQRDVAEGFRELQQLQDQKEALYPLACYYYDQKEYSSAYQLFHKLRKDNHFAQYRLALMLFLGQGVSTNHQKAFHYMKLAANNSNKYAQFIMGFYYEYGIFVKQSAQISMMWYEQSANQGFGEAQTAIANLLLNQIDVVGADGKLDELSDKDQLLKDQALRWLHKATSQENANALIRLGALHEEGILAEKDNKKIIEYYTRATNAPFVSSSMLSLAHYLMGINYRLGDLGLEQDFQAALNHLTSSADAGYAPAQRVLGLMYAQGIGAPKDNIKAIMLFEKAACQGDIRSLGLLATHQPNNLPSIALLYKKAAKAGSLTAQLSLAELLQRTGQHALAFKWFDAASKNVPATNDRQQKASILDFSVGFVDQRNLARLMVARYRYNGWGGVKQDRRWAFEEFRTLSNNGYPDAQYWLAACYEEGVKREPQESDDGCSWVVEPDLERAYKLYRKVAEAGDMDGQFQVAYMLSNGIGVAKDVNAAFSWYVQSAEQGHKTAQYSLGIYYETGLDIAVNLEKAKQWYTLAAKELPMAMVRLAKVLLGLDDDTEENIQQATDWLNKAIEKGDVTALRELANLYKNYDLQSLTASDRYRTAFDYFQQAADRDDALSWHALFKFYDGYYNTVQNVVVPEDFEKAVMCLEKAESLGFTPAILDLADLYYRNGKMDETMSIYSKLAASEEMQPVIAKKARIEAAKIVVFEKYGDEHDQTKTHSRLLDIISRENSKQLGELCEVYELLGYCAENGIGTEMNKDKAISYYIDCVIEQDQDQQKQQKQQQQHKHWAKQRALCRLVYKHMGEKDYQSAFVYLDMLEPSLDEMSQLPSEDAAIQSRRMKYFLGYLYIHGLGVEKDTREGLYWLSDAADKGEGDAAFEIGMHLSKHQQDNCQLEIRQRFEQGALTGHPACMRELAFLLLDDEADQSFLDEDYDGGAEILDLLQTASQLGDVKAMYRLGQAYENSLGDVLPEKDIEKALEAYMDAAEHGHEQAMLQVGDILGNIMGRHQEAMEWFENAADEFDNIKAKVMLISYSFQGLSTRGREQSKNEPFSTDKSNFEYLQEIVDGEIESMQIQLDPTCNVGDQQHDQLKLRKSGLGLAFYILGQCHELGRGTPVNLQQAKECYHRSALISDHVDAMWRLGVIHCELEDNDASALEWFRNAAEKGKHRESHYRLGIFHLHGLAGLEANIAVAKKHFSKAAEQGHPMATYELARIVWYKDADYLYGHELFKVAAQQLLVPEALRELGNLSHTGFSVHGIELCEQDYKAAFAYYCEAAQLGDAVAALMVGNYFEGGYLQEELEQDSEKALQWYESAYRLDCGGLSELAIGKLKHTIADTINDPKEADDMREEALVWFESAAKSLPDGPNFPARVMVALYYINGWGRKTRDTKAGLYMLLDIMELGGQEAIVLIAQCYEEGVGVEYDMSKAFEYWKMAADTNDPKALERLGDFYALGLTGQTDTSLANEYYARAKTLVDADSSRRHRGYSLESCILSSTSSASSSASSASLSASFRK
ncbi:hypothetical protein BD408DRAFT_483482 [Parasitella parasitica]|nr:hypothetical protein BD408DRAFT_483482 [Parasitella parasitica]